MTTERWHRRLLLATLVALVACAGGDGASQPAPSEQEIAVVQQSFCELYGSCGNLSPEITIEDCVENLERVYAFTEECFELRFAWESCAVEVAADIEANEPNGNKCDVFGEKGWSGPCAEKRGEALVVECNG